MWLEFQGFGQINRKTRLGGMYFSVRLSAEILAAPEGRG
jgi:hypothetical protein